ncbi:MAG: ATP-binding protein [Chlamydiales bacterium]
MDRQTLKSVIIDQNEIVIPSHYYEREAFASIKKFSRGKEVVILQGLRRSGKSTLLQVLRKDTKENSFFLNFDDDRLITFTLDDFQMLYELWIELYGVQRTFYFDEIQNIEGWERFVRRLQDKGMKVYATGSNANLLSAELGTRLTGRYLQVEVFPYSFHECVMGQKPELLESDLYTTEHKGELLHLFSHYCLNGGIPEFVEWKIVEFLHKLYEGVIFRDIIARYKLKQHKALLEMVYFLASNLGKMCSYNSLRKMIQLQSTTTVSEYCHYLQQSYLCFFVNRYSHSLKEQSQSQKKVYFIDHQLAKSIGFQIGANRGRMLENIVYIELRRRGKEIYYHQEKKECDFIIKNGLTIEAAYQVCAEWDDDKVKTREIEGLHEALCAYNLKEGWILTDDNENTLVHEGKMIHIFPIWKWLLKRS